MKRDAIDYLFKSKIRQGKSYNKSIEEIYNLKQSQLNLKNNVIEIKKLNKKLNDLQKINNKLKNKLFKLQFQIDSSKENEFKNNKNKNGDINILKRIMLVINGSEKLKKSEIIESCCSTSARLTPYLNFLEKQGMIKVEKIKGFKRYWK